MLGWVPPVSKVEDDSVCVWMKARPAGSGEKIFAPAAMTSSRALAHGQIRLDQDLLEQLRGRRRALRSSLDGALDALELARVNVETLRSQLDTTDARCISFKQGIVERRRALLRQLLGTFPTELLRAVFISLAQAPDELWLEDDVGCYNLERASTPFSLAAVCQRWRYIALTLPELWTYVGIPSSADGNERRSHSFFRYVQTVLDRSHLHLAGTRQHPLHVMLDWCTSSSWSVSDYHQRILDIVGRHARRWLRVHINFPTGFGAANANIFRRSTPLLEEFYTACSAAENRLPWTASSPVYLPDCPRLRRLDDQRLFIHPTQHRPMLTYISTWIHSISPALLWDVLRLTPSLKELHIEFLDMPQDVLLPPSSPISLPALTILGVYGQGTHFATWLSGLQLPSLTDLWQNTDTLAAFTGSYDALSDKIISLTLYTNGDDCPLEDGALRHLQRLARVRTLTLDYVDVAGSFFCHARSQDLCWSRLQSVALNDVALGEETASDFVDFVRSRSSESPSPFRIQITGSTTGPTWLQEELLAITNAHCTIDAYSMQMCALSSSSDSDSDSDDAEFTDGGSGVDDSGVDDSGVNDSDGAVELDGSSSDSSWRASDTEGDV